MTLLNGRKIAKKTFKPGLLKRFNIVMDVIHVYFACGLVVAGVVFDVLDGRIARWRATTLLPRRFLRAKALSLMAFA